MQQDSAKLKNILKINYPNGGCDHGGQQDTLDGVVDVPEGLARFALQHCEVDDGASEAKRQMAHAWQRS